jgi:hypothetical protein
MFLFLRDRLRVTGEMEKLTSDRKLIEKRGRVLVIWKYPEFPITGPPERWKMLSCFYHQTQNMKYHINMGSVDNGPE